MPSNVQVLRNLGGRVIACRLSKGDEQHFDFYHETKHGRRSGPTLPISEPRKKTAADSRCSKFARLGHGFGVAEVVLLALEEGLALQRFILVVQFVG